VKDIACSLGKINPLAVKPTVAVAMVKTSTGFAAKNNLRIQGTTRPMKETRLTWVIAVHRLDKAIAGVRILVPLHWMLVAGDLYVFCILDRLQYHTRNISVFGGTTAEF
jgi:hypothetical protein